VSLWEEGNGGVKGDWWFLAEFSDCCCPTWKEVNM